MFVAGMLTILLPCILPLVPIVLGVSIAGRSKLRPLFTIAGMLVSFVGFTFLLTVVLNQFVELAEYIRISTYYVLLLFGFGFLTHNKYVQITGAVLGGFFFWDDGWIVMTIAQTIGATLMEVGGWVAARIQQLGSDIQQKASGDLGNDKPITAFIIGLTMGLVWVPCAGPALGFALTLVREQPGWGAAALLATYGLGTAIPLLLIGYGGQAAAHSSRAFSKYSGRIKQVSGAILIFTAIALNYNWLRNIESFLVSNTSFGNIGVELEQKLFGEEI
ncbi:MAG: cytochrome c biogenesis CcdA family protein, partial [Candidatus Peribacteraceae bacterium]|nr:cytochrome c biogenesis CcdA family protein [Candidatus Peribacteraceae bacterium]